MTNREITLGVSWIVGDLGPATMSADVVVDDAPTRLEILDNPFEQPP